ncbi:hypothetical protein VTJ04DRAFT_2300 [Mycothermus thermophilus]|uniref:mitochondrial 37S ribosomal protein mS45 n=1 Tax=Humicola insolens TaxID=85995 RepID=UPI0037421802
MPPRLPSCGSQPKLLLNSLEQGPALPSAAAFSLLHRPTSSPSSSSSATPTPSSSSTTLPRCSLKNPARAFSTTPSRAETKLRREFKEWLDKVGPYLRRPPGEQGSEAQGPTYLTHVVPKSHNKTVAPFPQNPYFVSEPVLSERARNLIWYQVMVRGMPLKAVSAEYSVDVRRVAAVVRMMEIEKRWERENKPMATPLAKALRKMLPQHNLTPQERPFEPINDIPVHSYTQQQLFVPVSESRQFTRADAAKAFGEKILPPDEKMRIPELIAYERDLANGIDRRTARDRFVKATAASEQALAAKLKKQEQKAEERRIRVDTGRFEFRIEDIDSEDVGRGGRSRHAVGWRYGVPFMDRRRGEHKIPTSVGV